MANRYLKSFLSSTLSILPMILIILILSWVPSFNGTGRLVALSNFDYVAIVIGTLVLILGLSLFQIGAAQGLSRIGEVMGSSLSKQTKIAIVIIFAFLLGGLITCAEPSILIVASQVSIPQFVLIGMIASGVGIFVVIGVIRIICHKSLKIWYLFYYLIVFALICLIGIDPEGNAQKFLPFIFDAGGITTGSATVPFILALGAGVAVVRGGNHANEDSFGLVGMASIGPIISMTILILVNRSGFEDYVVKEFTHFEDAGSIFFGLGDAMMFHSFTEMGSLVEVAMSTIPILIIFLIYELIFIKLPKKDMGQIFVGFVYAYVGLVIFLSAVKAIMSPFGNGVGQSLGLISNDWIIVAICFAIGLVTILCEPAVHVLTTQIVNVSDGSIKKSTVLLTLSIGVGFAIGLAALRTLFKFNILYIVVPGYVLSLTLMFICPNIYTAMAFDAGGTASGPMSVSFVLPMLIGITYIREGRIAKSSIYYTQSFGVVALIALTPILAVQFLGIVTELKKLYQLRLMRDLKHDPTNGEIIHFK